MATYGCWDCGTEVAPYQGRCVVCGWPAPPPRRRRRAPKILLLGFLGSFVVVGAVVAMSQTVVPAEYQGRAAAGRHRWSVSHRYRQGRALSGTVFRCENCGARETDALRSGRCPGPAGTRR